MNIGNGLNAIGRFTVDTSLSVYGFGRDAFAKGCSVCSSLAARVIQIAGKAIPNAVSNTVKANPKSFCFAAGIIASGGIITAIASRTLSNHKKTAADQAEKMNQDTVKVLNSIKDFITNNDIDNVRALLDSELSKHAS
ncbi:MAG: hypothetical protein ACRDAI_07075 [Candidatus Rhabdochlamydia sp.]